jgi:hypothetical protein
VFKPPLLAEPPELPLPDAAQNPGWYGEFWLKYPLSETLIPVHFGHLFQTMSNLRLLINELGSDAFIGNKSTSVLEIAVIRKYLRRMEFWYNGIPEVLAVTDIKFPWELKLQ